MMNIVTATDSYKMTHPMMAPPNTEIIYSYFESRVGAKYNKTVFYGLQYILKEYLEGVVVTQEKIDQAEKFADAHFGQVGLFNRTGWEHILNVHDGKLPIKIMAVPEGTLVTVSNVMMTVENTDPVNCHFLTGHLETILTHIWSTCTVATASYSAKKIIQQHLINKDDADFMLHDFGFRGASSIETAATAGSAHLLNFKGSDTIPAIEHAMKYYPETNGDYSANMPAFSVVATEHSIMTAEGEEGEIDVIKRILDRFPSGILSIVSDSYDIYRCCEKYYGKILKKQILNRDGVLVVRPDSGEPSVVTQRVVSILWEKFGGTIDKFGNKLLNDKIRVLWGDGISNSDMIDILNELRFHGFAAENMVFGMGGGLIQKWNRDTQRFAFKSSAQRRDGEWFDVYKDPIDGTKASKRGQLMLVKNNGEMETVRKGEYPESANLLKTVFLNGEITKTYSFSEVRENLKKSSKKDHSKSS